MQRILKLIASVDVERRRLDLTREIVEPPDFRLARIIRETQCIDEFRSKDDLYITLQTQIMRLKTYFNTKIFLSHIYSLSRTFEVLVVYFEILYSAFIITFPRKTTV
jgi:hypothetical protein